ncbi:asparaginase [Limibacillus halophilus]|uniref:L-asparaginase II n=1 Tax=Limibacillus halophilus TaxID=1579333 RepID=A0A839SWE1_9PROT|nr:asparaginase [Limibacillus halophilus]MBB3066359.1 L-asparaginase II [Limibacillus halophilus]
MLEHEKDTTGESSSSGKAHANPLLVELTRGDMVESVHRARYAVVDNEGRVVLQAGDIEAPIYARSAIKSLQAIPLIETGAAEAFGLGDAEISMACASHDGEPRHVETVLAWLERIGCGVEDLECGAHLPYDPASMESLLRSGNAPTAAHNNCSGKHSGFLTTARHKGEATKGYIRRDHPVQQRILGVLEAMTGLDLSRVPMGIDGCGIPVIGMPLGNIALAMARLGSPDDQPDRRQEACARIRGAIANEPIMMGGTRRFDSRVIAAVGGRAIVKTGAEGVYCGTVPDLGLGFAVKVDDGAGRASEIVAGALLRRLGVIDDQQAEALSELLRPAILNRAGRDVGVIRTASAARF